MNVLFGPGGDDPLPPSGFVERLRVFDPGLRVVWGLKPYLRECWVIERQVPKELYFKTYRKYLESADPRFSDQTILDASGKVIGGRLYDTMPEWHAVYSVIDKNGKAMDLGDHVIVFLRQNYERTLLGIPELSMRLLTEDRAKQVAADRKRQEDRIDRSAREVMDHKFEIWKDLLAFGGQPRQVFTDKKEVN